jgi:energy-coupling factor transport system ATP-binding protein
MAEHRLERVVQYVDRVLYLAGDGSVVSHSVRDAMEQLPLAPPIARVGRALGWKPLPLSVREGKRFVGRSELPAAAAVVAATQPLANGASIAVDRLHLSYGQGDIVRDVSLRAAAGEVLALMGRNGAGKTSLLRALVGLLPPRKGSIRVLENDVTAIHTEELTPRVAFVPQDPASILLQDTVEGEIADTLRGTRRRGSVDEALREWRLDSLRRAHPRDLSAGERQRAALAAMLAGRPSVILLDEPTRGMDYETKELLIANLRCRCREGCTVILASHDVELVGSCAQRVVLLADGAVVADGPAREVLTESVTFSTQVNKLFGGQFLTVEDVICGNGSGRPNAPTG